jgi:uncharacterized protein YjeT (DUF2065 family)
MLALVKTIGIFITLMGITILFYPKIAQQMMAFWRQEKKLYLAGLFRILLGVIFLYSAPHAKLPRVLFALGILALLGGLLIFALGLEKTKAIIEKWEKKPAYSLRWFSLLIITFGILILSSA